MENYVLYDEIGRGERSVVYKGRKKGTIEFVAIHCVDKSKRFELRNMVRLTHDLAHPNVVKFHEWYETANHIWMVVELCTGYNLDVLISQDKLLPEATVKYFAVEVIKALFYIHSLGLVYCDLKPSKLLLDGPGHVKLSDFTLARVEGEDDIFEMAIDDDDDYDAKDIQFPRPSPHYMAPEVLMGSTHSKASDLWSLGCLLFELFTGKQPFIASSLEELAEKILGEPCPDIKQDFNGETIEGSKNFQEVISQLLIKDPHQRLCWSELITHPFFDHSLHELIEDTNNYYSMQTEKSAQGDGKHDVVITECDGIEEEVDKQPIEVVNEETTKKQVEKKVKQGTYTFKSLPKNVASKLEDLKIEDQRNGQTNVPSSESNLEQIKSSSQLQNSDSVTERTKHNNFLSSDSNSFSQGLEKKTVVLNQLNNTSSSLIENSPDSRDVVFHSSDFIVAPIVDNIKIKKFATPKFDSKALCCQPLKAEEILSLSDVEKEAHFNAIEALFSPKQKGSSTASSMQRYKLHTSAYLSSLCRNGDIANLVFESGLIQVLLYQVKNGFSSDLKARIAHCLGLLASSATLISEDFHMTEVFAVLTEVIRDNFRNIQLKQHLVPALGEFLFYASTQEDTEGRQIVKWDIPGTTFVIITRCLNDGEDIHVQHFAAKTIENVASTHCRHCTKFVTTDTAQLLWKLFTHCTADNQKVTAISALCRLTYQSASVFQYVIEKAGFNKVVDAFSSSVSQVQQAMLTMFTLLLSTKPQARRVIQEKELVGKVMRLLESPSPIIRGKAFLVIMATVQGSRDALLACCHSRLVMHIEKDQRRGTPLKNETPDNNVYLLDCLHHCIASVVDTAFHILEDVLTSLKAIEGRRHPSASHTKQLRAHLPNFPVILHLITSHVFRSLIVTEAFLSKIGALLGHVKSVDCGQTNLGTATGHNAAQDLTYIVLSVVECITQHPPLLVEFAGPISDHILPMLVELVHSDNGNTRALCFRLFSEVASLYLDNGSMRNSIITTDSMVTGGVDKVKQIIFEKLLPQYHLILHDQNPLPAYGIKLLSSLMDRCPDSLQPFLNQDMVLSLLHIIQTHSHEGNTSMSETLSVLIQTVLTNQEIDMAILYQQGLIDSIKSLFLEIPSLSAESNPDNDDTGPLISLLDSLYVVLKYVSKEVRHALQERSKNSPESESLNQAAEVLLVNTKPIADVTGVLIRFLSNEDTKVQEGACKNLYLMAELFGGLYQGSMSQDNVKYFAEALQKQDELTQKQLLRIIKRIISSNSQHCKAILNHGQALLEQLNELETHSKIEAIRVLSQEILHKIAV